MLANHRESIDIEKGCSSRKSSITGVDSWGLSNLERKSATTLDFPGLSTIVILNSYNNSKHLVTLPLVNGLFMKYCIEEWSVCTNTSYPII